MAITVTLYEPLAGTIGENLWREGESSYVDAGLVEARPITSPPPGVFGFVAEVDGELAGLQACRTAAAPGAPDLPAGVAEGVLSWVRPGFRRLGVFTSIQRAVDTELAARGCTEIRSTVIGGSEAAAMIAAIAARGGVRLQVFRIKAISRDVENFVYQRILRPGE